MLSPISISSCPSVAISKRSVLRDIQNRQRSFGDGFITVPSSILLSYLGAKVCYSPNVKQLIDLVSRGVDVERQVIPFLMSLKQEGHFSVFAHTPIILHKKLSGALIDRIPWCLFKVYEDSDYIILNLQHFAEGLFDNEFKDLLYMIWDGNKPLKFNITTKVNITKLESKQKYEYMAARGQLNEEGEVELIVESYKKPITIYKVDFEEFKYSPYPRRIPDWRVYIIDGISRVCSHQLMRHTAINFNQKSNRYTAVVEVMIPPSHFEGENKLPIFKETIEKSMKSYYTWILLGKGKREDARFFAPTGTTTTIIGSAPVFIWADFCNKRNIEGAQWEIRTVAEIIQNTIIDDYF